MSDRGKKVLHMIWLLVSPLLVYEAVCELTMFADEMVWGGTSDSDVLLLSTLAALMASAVLGIWYLRDGKRERSAADGFSFRSAGIVVIGAVGACLFANHLLILAGVPSAGFEAVQAQLYRPPLAVQIAGTGLLIPLAEELVFRGLGYGRLRREWSFAQAAWISSVFFGLYHGNLIQGMYALMLGFLIAMAYEAYGSLWAAWLFHAVANLTSVLLTASSAAAWLQIHRGRMGIVMAAGGLLAAGSVYKMREEIS